MAVDYSTKELVRAQAVALRQKHDALDWGTPIDALIECAGFSQGKYSATGVGAALRRAVDALGKKIKALIHLKEEVILLATDLHQAKHPFAKGHELGHGVIPWHKDVLYVCDEHDLSADARAQLEYEANEFSSEILIPRPLLARVYNDYPISMDTVLLIRNWSGASIEMCANAYAGNHPQKCVLGVLEERTKQDGSSVLVLKRKVVSAAAARDQMSTLETEQEFKPEHVLYRAAMNARQGVQSCELTLRRDGQVPRQFQVSVLNNSYRTFALIYE